MDRNGSDGVGVGSVSSRICIFRVTANDYVLIYDCYILKTLMVLAAAAALSIRFFCCIINLFWAKFSHFGVI